MGPIGSEIARAETYLTKGDYILAATHFFHVAEIYLKEIKRSKENTSEKAQYLDAMKKFFRKAIDSYLLGKNYGLFVDFLKKHTLKLFPSPTDQIEIFKDAATKLIQLGALKHASTLVKQLAYLYKTKPLQNLEKATYYELLAPQIEAGITDIID
ncbi:MAG TPA: hypothetical protein VMV49_17550 [Candidatus Deferrimicrobium sp.]|nr:hypothetical protein [Candidatus Deferrimicrobium sp.]